MAVKMLFLSSRPIGELKPKLSYDVWPLMKLIDISKGSKIGRGKGPKSQEKPLMQQFFLPSYRITTSHSRSSTHRLLITAQRVSLWESAKEKYFENTWSAPISSHYVMSPLLLAHGRLVWTNLGQVLVRLDLHQGRMRIAKVYLVKRNVTHRRASRDSRAQIELPSRNLHTEIQANTAGLSQLVLLYYHALLLFL